MTWGQPVYNVPADGSATVPVTPGYPFNTISAVVVTPLLATPGQYALSAQAAADPNVSYTGGGSIPIEVTGGVPGTTCTCFVVFTGQ